MADTITVLDGIQFQKETSSDVWTVDDARTEVVKTFPIHIPTDAKSARVIFNGTYDPDGGRYHVRVNVTKVTDISVPTKTANTTLLDWTAVTPPAVQESGDVDVSAAQVATFHIDIAISSTTANTTGIEIICQYRKEDTVEEWTDIAGGRFTAMIGTGIKSDFGAQEVAGQTELTVTDPATGGLDNIGKFIFLEDTATIVQSEIAFLVSQSGD